MPINEIKIIEKPNSYHVFFPYKHETGWRGFKQAGMVFKTAINVGGSSDGVYWVIQKAGLKVALDVIQYWYTERPMVGHPNYGVRIVEAMSLAA